MKKTSSGALSLAVTAERISNVEVAGYRFTGSSVVGTSNVHVYIDTVDAPPRPQLVRLGTPVPALLEIVWTGKLLEAGKLVDTQMLRKKKSDADHVAPADSLVGAQAPTAAIANVIPSMDPPIPIVGRDDVVRRAQSGVGTATTYESPGITPPLFAESWPDVGGRIDCSGFVAWCFRMARRVNHPLYLKVNQGWFETRALHRDGQESTGLFRPLDRARPGSLVVFPDRNGKQGHVGIVVEVTGDGVAGISKVVHSSSGNFKKTGRAIQVTDASVWKARDDTLIIDYEGFVD